MSGAGVRRRADQLVLEGIVTTLDPDAESGANVSPMGPWVTEAMDEIVLRPFPSSRTYANLKRHPEGVLHVTDDVELFARAAIGRVTPPLERAQVVDGFVLRDCCRSYEFRVVDWDECEERRTLRAVVVHRARHRDFVGFHRARHAVLEAAILATRVSFLPEARVLEELARLEPLIEKTGGAREASAFEVLRAHIATSYLAERNS